MPRNASGDNGAGIYVHIPFCRRRCPYCDFAVSVQVDIPHRRYTEAVIGELRRRRSELGDRSVKTIYFGGGTPSLLAPRFLGQIVDAIDDLFGADRVEEVTLEANPNEVTQSKLEAWKSLGIDRVSIGCQSFQDRHLKKLRRTHDGQEARRAAEAALQVMERVSIDLMFAGPSQSMAEWEADLKIMQRLVNEGGLDHVSGYNLTIEPGTTFWIRQKQGIVSVPGHDTAAQMLDRLVEATAHVGLQRYEVSNFAVDQGESKHNRSYWRGRPYLGVGVGAHSLAVDDDGSARRRANSGDYDEYMQGAQSSANIERLEPQQHLAERLFLGARTVGGIDLEALRHQFNPAVPARRWEHLQAVLDDLVERGWMQRVRARYGPTARGLNFADSLAEWLFEAATD